MHIAKILKEGELDAFSVIKNYFTTASDGKPYDVMYYSLQMPNAKRTKLSWQIKKI